MNIKKAIEHFEFKFQKNWKPTPTDIIALNCIIEFVNDKHSNQLQDNEMLAKLLVYVYASELKRRDWNIFDPYNTAQKWMGRYLERPMDQVVELFKDRLNEAEKEAFALNNKIEVLHPAIGKTDPKLDDFVEPWEYEEVREHLELIINLFINQFKTLKL